MIFKKPISSILLAFAISVCILVGIGQNPILAATLIETRPIFQEEMETMSKKPVNLELGIDRFLASIPPGYYTISSIEGLKSQLVNSQTLLVDVRELSEYQLGHIPNAINIPLQTLAQNLDQIPQDRPVVLYCSSGYRSGMGVASLHLLGYENVRGFPLSFTGWKTAGEAIASN